ncbi:hypothetical protein KKF84_13840 [Myxococcota bacterium]|nr:hypothetical protein [Myxococcota bacterium]
MKAFAVSLWLLCCVLAGCSSTPATSSCTPAKSVEGKQRSRPRPTATPRLPKKKATTMLELQNHLRAMMVRFNKGKETYFPIYPVLKKYVADADHPIHYQRKGWVTAKLVEHENIPVALLFTHKAMYLEKNEEPPKNHDEFTKTRNFVALIMHGKGKQSPRITVREIDFKLKNHDLKTTILSWTEQTWLLTISIASEYQDNCCGDEDGGADKEATLYGLFIIHGGNLHQLDAYYTKQEMMGKWGALTLNTEYRFLKVPGEPLPLIYFENRNIFKKVRGVRRTREMDPPCQRETKIYRVVFNNKPKRKPLKALTAAEIKTLSTRVPMLKNFPQNISTYDDRKNRCKGFE